MRPQIRNKTVAVIPGGFGPEEQLDVSVVPLTFDTAVVVDVVTNTDHPRCSSDGYNVGSVLFRSLKSNVWTSEEDLPMAMPLESNISKYPLKNELILITSLLNRYYYISSINITNRSTTDAVYGMNQELELKTTVERTADYRAAEAGVTQTDDVSHQNVLGEYFEDSPAIMKVFRLEGDVVMEGRSGQSIRLTMNPLANQLPTIKIRNGQGGSVRPTLNSPFGTVKEDINADLSSIWLTGNELVPIRLSTMGSEYHYKSIDTPPSQLDGNQVVITTGRMIFNTKTDAIMGHSHKGIHWTSLGSHTIDSEQNLVVNLGGGSYLEARGNKFSTIKGHSLDDVYGNLVLQSRSTTNLTGTNVYIGNRVQSQPMVLGTELLTWLTKLCQELMTEKHPTPSGPSGPPLNAAKYAQLRADLMKILSSNNFVSKTNAVPGV